MSHGNLGTAEGLGGILQLTQTHTLGTAKHFWLGIPRPHPTTPARDSQLWLLSSSLLAGTHQPRGDRSCSQRPLAPARLRDQHLVGCWPCSPHPPVNGLRPHPELCHTILCDSWSQACEMAEIPIPLCLLFNLLRLRVISASGGKGAESGSRPCLETSMEQEAQEGHGDKASCDCGVLDAKRAIFSAQSRAQRAGSGRSIREQPLRSCWAIEQGQHNQQQCQGTASTNPRSQRATTTWGQTQPSPGLILSLPPLLEEPHGAPRPHGRVYLNNSSGLQSLLKTNNHHSVKGMEKG